MAGANRVGGEVQTRARAHQGLVTWFGRNLPGYLFILPMVVFLVMYQAYPIIRVFIVSFTNYQYLNPGLEQFVGLTNYINALQDSDVWNGLRIALEFTLIFIPGGVLFPVVLALLLDRVRVPWLAGIYRTVLYLPALIPGPLVFILWNWIYNPSLGVLNWLIIDVFHLATHANPPLWLGSDLWAVPAIAFMEWWWGLGYHTLFMMVGLSTIPGELYEAARLDGASEPRTAWHVSLPLLKPMLLIILVLRTGTAFGLLVEYLVLRTASGSTQSWTVYMYDLAFQNGQLPWGYAAAIGWIGALCMLVAVGVQYRVLRTDY
jgi:multiple sugar transport system permease protein